jgi:hypothetical protein
MNETPIAAEFNSAFNWPGFNSIHETIYSRPVTLRGDGAPVTLEGKGASVTLRGDNGSVTLRTDGNKIILYGDGAPVKAQ